jgi:hypothetical protein
MPLMELAIKRAARSISSSVYCEISIPTPANVARIFRSARRRRRSFMKRLIFVSTVIDRILLPPAAACNAFAFIAAKVFDQAPREKAD